MRGVEIGLVIAALFLTACDQKGSVESTKERAKAQEEAGGQVQNEIQAKKAQLMEADLANRHAFYGALEGNYEGTLAVAKEVYNIKFTLIRNIPPFSGSRVRQLSEIENDLNNLYFHIQVVQWHPADPSSAVGCRVTGIKPNMDSGTLNIASVDCPNLYSILLSENGQSLVVKDSEKSAQVASKVKNRSLNSVPFLIGTVQPSTSASKYSFSVKKVKGGERR